MKIFTYILFLYFSTFYVLGASNIKSIYDNIAGDMEYAVKDIKKEMDKEEKEDEESKDKSIFHQQRLTHQSLFTSVPHSHFYYNDNFEYSHINNIFIPPPEYSI